MNDPNSANDRASRFSEPRRTYARPHVQTLSADEIFRRIGPAQGLASGGPGGNNGQGPFDPLPNGKPFPGRGR